MAQPLACPSCSRSLSIPDDAAGKRLRCPSCQTMLRVMGTGEGLALEIVDGTDAAKPEQDEATSGADRIGEPASAAPQEPVESPKRSSAGRSGGSRAGRSGGRRDSSSASVQVVTADEEPKGLLEKPHLFLLAIGILLFVTGFYSAWQKQSYIEEKLGDKAYAEPHEIIVIDGNRYRVGDVRKPYEDDIMFTKITYFGLGIMMIAMFWWARAAAFPALVTALGGFGIVYFLLGLKGAINGDFRTLIEDWPVKLVSVGVLLYGIRIAKHQHIALVQSGRYQSKRKPPARGGRSPRAAKAAP